MPQGPIPVAQTPSIVGTSSVLNVTAAAVIKATPGTLAQINVVNAGTSGSLVVNDCATTATATTANQILNLTQAQVAALGAVTGGVIDCEFPCKVGLTVSAVPAGSQLAVSYD